MLVGNPGSRHYIGTFWYHGHFSVQYCDGLKGPLIIKDPRDPFAHMYDIDNGMWTRYNIGTMAVHIRI